MRSGASYGEGAAQRSDGMGGANIADALAVACALDRRVVTVRRTPDLSPEPAHAWRDLNITFVPCGFICNVRVVFISVSLTKTSALPSPRRLTFLRP